MLGHKSVPKTESKKKANPVVIKSDLCYVLNFKCIKSISENILSIKGYFSKGKNGAKKCPNTKILKKYSFKGVLEGFLMELRTLEHIYTKLSKSIYGPFMPRNGPKQAIFHDFCI